MIHNIAVSETMRKKSDTFREVTGLWESIEGRIVVKRDQLETLEAYAGILLHETGHAMSRAPDSSRSFESKLTRNIGLITSEAIRTLDWYLPRRLLIRKQYVDKEKTTIPHGCE